MRKRAQYKEQEFFLQRGFQHLDQRLTAAVSTVDDQVDCCRDVRDHRGPEIPIIMHVHFLMVACTFRFCSGDLFP
jgi:hypothetical protein